MSDQGSGDAGSAHISVIPSVGAAGASTLLSSLAGPLSSAMGVVATAGLAMGAAIVGGIGIAGAAVVSFAADLGKGTKQIRFMTGATGEELTKLGQSFRNIVGTVSGAGLDDYSEAIGRVAQRTKATGPELEQLAQQFLRLKKVSGEELPGLIEAAGKAFAGWGVETSKQSGELDFLNSVAQNSGIRVTDLSEKLAKFRVPLQELGFSFEDSAALMGKFEKEGVNTDAALAGLKISLAKAAKAGEDPIHAFNRLTGEIKGAGSEGEANAKALKLFGARAGPELAKLIREGKFEIGDFIDGLKENRVGLEETERTTRSFGERVSLIFQKLGVIFEPVGKAFLTFRTQVLDKLEVAFGGLIKIIQGDLIGGAVDLGKIFGLEEDSAATNGLFFFIGLLKSVVDDIKNGGIGEAFKNLGDRIRFAWPFILVGLQEIASNIFGWLRDQVAPLIETIRSWAQAFVEWLVPNWGPITEKLGELVGALGSWLLDTGLPWIASHLAEWGVAFLEWIIPLDAKIAVELGKLVGKLVAWIATEGLPKLKDKLVEWGTAFWGWLQEVWPPFLAGLEVIKNQIGDWLVTVARPWILEHARELGAGLWGWIQESGPKVLLALAGLQFIIGGWIATVAVPWLFEKWKELMPGMTRWVADAIPVVLGKLGEWALALATWIDTVAIPWLFAKGQELSAAFRGWLTDAIPRFLGNLVDWLAAFGGWIVGTAIPWLIGKGIELSVAFGAWIGESIPKLIAKLNEWGEALVRWITGTAVPWLFEKGKELNGAILGWIGDAITSAPEKLSELGKKIFEFVTSLPAQIASAASGLWNGIGNAFVAVINFIIRKWNDFQLKIPEIEILGQKVGGFTLDTPNLPEIPGLFRGGRALTSGTAVVGERGAEVAKLHRGDMIFPKARLDAELAGAGGGGFSVGEIKVFEQAGRGRNTAIEVRHEMRKAAFLATPPEEAA